VCESRFKVELRTRRLSPPTFVVAGVATVAACGMASRSVALGRLCHFGIPPARFLSRFGERRDSRRGDRMLWPRISPQRYKAAQSPDFLPMVVRRWFPNRERESRM